MQIAIRDQHNELIPVVEVYEKTGLFGLRQASWGSM